MEPVMSDIGDEDYLALRPKYRHYEAYLEEKFPDGREPRA
jgi:hypothetical protein